MVKPHQNQLSSQNAGVTWRSVLLGLILIPLNCIWVVQVEIVHYSGHPTCQSIFSNAIFSLFLVILVNLGLRALRPVWAMSQGELIVVYVMVSLGSSVAAHDMMQMLVPTMAHVAWFATPENKWEQTIQPLLQDWYMVLDPTAVSNYHEGRSDLLAPENYRPWLMPMLSWGLFITVLVFVMQCINCIMRRQWMDNEKLSYPLTQLPMELTRGGGASGLYSNKVFWSGFILAAGLDIYNGIAFLYPVVPLINVKVRDISASFAANPWNAIGWTPVSFYPFMIGLGFFLPQDVSFSCWFFYLFRKLIQVFAAATGWGRLPGAPFLIEQSWGAWMAFAGLAIYSGRRYLTAVWNTVWGGEGALDDAHEPMRYRYAMVGLVGGLIYLVLFFVKAGAEAIPMLLYFILYFGLFSAVSKMRAEIGPPTHELGGMGTTLMLAKIIGSRNLSPHTLTSYALLWFNNRMVRSHQMPVQLEALKMAQRTGIDYRRLGYAMLAAIVMGVVSGFGALLGDAYYNRGATGTGFAGEAFGQLHAWLNAPTGPDFRSMLFMAGGAGITLLLGAARMQIVGWQLHPAGYALGMVFGLDYIWLPLFIAWMLKTLVLRYGGLRIHANIIPFVVGIILGEFVVGSLWSSLSVLLGKPMYNFWIF